MIKQNTVRLHNVKESKMCLLIVTLSLLDLLGFSFIKFKELNCSARLVCKAPHLPSSFHLVNMGWYVTDTYTQVTRQRTSYDIQAVAFRVTCDRLNRSIIISVSSQDRSQLNTQLLSLMLTQIMDSSFLEFLAVGF